MLGNGAEDSAAMVALYADINGTLNGAPDVSLANGQKVTLSGSATMSGIVSSMEQFRWGLFNETSAPFDAIAWRGYIARNSAGSGGGALRAKDAEATTFAQTGSAVNLRTEQDGDDFIDETYNFSMSVSRFNNEVSIDASLTSAEDWSQVWKDVVTAVPNQVTFDFNRVGFLAGSGMHANQINFNNIDVTVGPIDALTLQVTTTGQNAGTVQIRNNRPSSFEIEYYEIKSASASLDLNRWNSLDDHEGDDPPLQGWDESAGNDATLLSEIALFSTTTVGPSGLLDLGRPFNVAGIQDLKFHVGLADGSYVRGSVEYVPGILTGDYNGDNVVDAADYVVWRKTLNQTVPNGTRADGDGNGVIQQADYTVWRANFGNTAGSGAGLNGIRAVPEPGMLGLLASLALVVSGCHRRCTRRTR